MSYFAHRNRTRKLYFEVKYDELSFELATQKIVPSSQRTFFFLKHAIPPVPCKMNFKYDSVMAPQSSRQWLDFTPGSLYGSIIR